MGQLYDLLDEADERNGGDEELKEVAKYHDKQYKIFKQQKMPMLGGGHQNQYT